MDAIKAGAELAAFESAERISRSLPDIQELFSKFKITNCLSRVIEIVNARSPSQALHSITQLLELYDVLWKIPSSVSLVFNKVVYFVITSLPRLFTEIREFLKKSSGETSIPEEEFFLANDELRNQSGETDVFELYKIMLDPTAPVLESIKHFLGAHGGLGATILGWIGALVLLFGGGGLMLTSTLATRVAKTVTNLGSTIKGLESIGKGFGYVSNIVTESIANILGLEVAKPVTARDQLVTQILAINADFKQTVTDFKSDPTKWLTCIRKVKKLNDSLKGVSVIYEELARTTENMASCHSALIELRTNIKQISDFYDNIVNSMVGKVVPVTLYLFGDSGVGKSHVATYIAELLKDDETTVSTVYPRNVSDQYWSGYCGQNVVLYDDFNQDKENTDHKELIGIYTGASFLPRFADLASKGDPFTSPFVILCSNTPSVESSKAIVTAAALDRRRDFVFKVTNPVYQRMVAEARPKEERNAVFQADYSHLVFEEYTDVKDKSGHMRRIERGGRNSLHLIVAAMKRLKTERMAEYSARVTEKMSAIKAGSFQYLDPQVQALLANATRRLDTLGPQELAPPTNPPSAASNKSDDSEDSLTLDQVEEAMNHGIDLRPHYGRRMREQARSKFLRKPAILLMGPPGIGKSQFIQYKANCEGKDIEHYDEFPQDDTDFKAAVAYVWAAYEGKEDQYIMACNPETLDAMFLKHYPRDNEIKKAFLRRCEIFELEFNKKSWIFNTKYTMEDLQDKGLCYDDIITITHTSITQKKRVIPKQQLEQLIEKGIEVRNEVQRTRALREIDVVCEIEIGFNLTQAQVAVPDFSIPISQVPSLMKVFKGNPYAHLHRLVELTALFSKKVGTIEDSMMCFNDLERLPNGLPTVGITFADESRFILITNEDGLLEVCKAPHIYKEVTLCDEEARKLTLERMKTEDPKNFVFFQFVDLIGFVLKVGSVFYMLYNHGIDQRHAKVDHQLRMKRKQDFISAMKDEGAEYDDLDDWFDDYLTHMGKPHPKSYLNKERKDKYCSEHHTMDRCYLLESEASRRPLMSAYNQEDGRRNKHVDASFIIESGDEYRDVQKKHALKKVVEESGDEYKDVQKKHAVKKVIEQESVREQKIKKGLIAETKDGKTDFLVPESALDPGAIAQAHVIFKNNLVATKSGMVFNRVLMLKNHTGVINNHAVPNTQEFDVSDGVNTWKAVVFYRNEIKDIAFFKLPPQAPQFVNITSYLCSRTEIKSVSNRHGILLTPYRERNLPPFASWKAIMLRDAIQRDIQGKQRYGINYSGHSLGVTYDSAPILTQPGDCGSAIILNDPQCAHKLLGIHGAGSHYHGFGSIITQQDVSDAELTLKQETREVPIKVLKHQCVNTEWEGTCLGMEVFGQMEKDGRVLKQFVPETTKYHVSPFKFDKKFGHAFEPAVMSVRDTRCTAGANPYKDAIEKWYNPQPEVDTDLLDLATAEIGNHLGQIVKAAGYKVSVLTKVEAINGIGGVPGSNPIYRQSSAGFPWKHMQNVQRKAAFFALNEDTCLQEISKEEPGKSLNHAVDSLICCAKEGFRPAVVFCSALKDEPLKLKKIYEVTKTRTFAASPVDYTIASRMYFHGVAGSLTSLFHKTPIKIGINPAGTDFHDLYLYHAEVSTAGFDGDFANWDGSIPKVFMERAGEIYNIIYQMCDPKWKPEDDIIRRNLHACVEGPLINYHELVLKCPGGNPSGQPQTTLDNCLCNYLLGYYVFAKVMKKANKDWSFSNFLKTVRPSYFGDDNMYTVDPDVIGTFNFVTFKEEAEKIGFTLTNAAKDGKIERFIKLEDMEFLKRNFTRIDGRWYGALVDASMCKMLSYAKAKAHFFWQHKDEVAFDRETIEDTVHGCLLESALKGKEFYDEIAQHLREKCIEYGFSKTIPTYYTAKVQALYEGASSLVEKFTTDLENESKDEKKKDKTYKLTLEDPITHKRETIIVNRGSCCLPLLEVEYDKEDRVDHKKTEKAKRNWIEDNLRNQKFIQKAYKKTLTDALTGRVLETLDEFYSDQQDRELQEEGYAKYGATDTEFLTYVGEQKRRSGKKLENQTWDPYKVLNLKRDCTLEELKDAYKKLARIWHPDKHQTDRDIATKKFQEIGRAYQEIQNFLTKSFAPMKDCDDLWKEFFGNMTLDEAIEDFLNDPIFVGLDDVRPETKAFMVAPEEDIKKFGGSKGFLDHFKDFFSGKKVEAPKKYSKEEVQFMCQPLTKEKVDMREKGHLLVETQVFHSRKIAKPEAVVPPKPKDMTPPTTQTPDDSDEWEDEEDGEWEEWSQFGEDEQHEFNTEDEEDSDQEAAIAAYEESQRKKAAQQVQVEVHEPDTTADDEYWFQYEQWVKAMKSEVHQELTMWHEAREQDEIFSIIDNELPSEDQLDEYVNQEPEILINNEEFIEVDINKTVTALFPETPKTKKPSQIIVTLDTSITPEEIIIPTFKGVIQLGASEERKPETVTKSVKRLFFLFHFKKVVRRIEENGSASNNSGGRSTTDDRRQHTGESNEAIRTRSSSTGFFRGSVSAWNSDQRRGSIPENSVHSRFDNSMDRPDESRNGFVLPTYSSLFPESDSSISNEAVQLLEGEHGIQDGTSRDRIQCRQDRDIQAAAEQEARRHRGYRRVVSPSIRNDGRKDDGGIHESRFRPSKYLVSLQSTKLGGLLVFWWLFCNCCHDEIGGKATRRCNQSACNEQDSRGLRSWTNSATKAIQRSWERSKALQRIVSAASRGCDSSTWPSENRVHESVASSTISVKERYLWRASSQSSTSEPSSSSRKTRSHENGLMENETSSLGCVLSARHVESSVLDNRCRTDTRSREFSINPLQRGRRLYRRIFDWLERHWDNSQELRQNANFGRRGLRFSESGDAQGEHSENGSARGSRCNDANLQRREPGGFHCVQCGVAVGLMADACKCGGSVHYKSYTGRKRLSPIPGFRDSNRTASNATKAVSRGFLYDLLERFNIVTYLQALQNRASRYFKQNTTDTGKLNCGEQSKSEGNDSNKGNQTVQQESVEGVRRSRPLENFSTRRGNRLRLEVKPRGLLSRIGAVRASYGWMKGFLEKQQPEQYYKPYYNKRYSPNGTYHFNFPFWYPISHQTELLDKAGYKTWPKHVLNVYDKVKDRLMALPSAAYSAALNLKARNAGYKKLNETADTFRFNSNINHPNELKRNDARVGSRQTAPSGSGERTIGYSSNVVGSNQSGRRNAVPGLRDGGPTRVQLPGTHTSSSSTDLVTSVGTNPFSDRSSEATNNNSSVHTLTTGVPFNHGDSRTYRDNRFASNSFTQTRSVTSGRGTQVEQQTKTAGSQATVVTAGRSSQATPNTTSRESNTTVPYPVEQGSKGTKGKAALVGVAAGAHVAASISTSVIHTQAEKQMQKSRQEFAKEWNQGHKDALAQVGLPSYLAYGNPSSMSTGAMHTGQVHAGKSVYQSTIPGNSQSNMYTGSAGQIAMGWGNVLH